MAVSCSDQAVGAQVGQASRHDLAGRADSVGDLLLGRLRLEQARGQLVAAGSFQEIERHTLLYGSEGVQANGSDGMRIASGEIRCDRLPKGRIAEHAVAHGRKIEMGHRGVHQYLHRAVEYGAHDEQRAHQLARVDVPDGGLPPV